MDEALSEFEIYMKAVKARYDSNATIDFYHQYIKKLSQRNVPIILTFKHLADILGIDPATLNKLTFATDFFYKEFFIKKRRGGNRKINSPNQLLRDIQCWIKDEILESAHPEFKKCVTAWLFGSSRGSP